MIKSMRKIIFTIIALTFSVFVSAARLEILSGDVNVLKENATCSFVLDLTNATFERKENFKDWCGINYDERVYLMETAFPESFNKKTKGLRIVTDESSAKYKIVLHIDNFVRKMGRMYGASAWMRIDGYISIVEMGTNKEVLRIGINKFYGDQDFKETDRFPKAVSVLAEKIHKLK